MDLVVVGSGAAGLTAALTGADAGLTVIVLEAAELIGGSTAYSEGMVWVPLSDEATAARLADDATDAERYLLATSDGRGDPRRIRAYIDAAPDMLRFVQRASPLRFALNRRSMDYYPDAPGARSGMRAHNPLPWDARSLPRPLFARLRPPLEPMTLFGGMSVASQDLPAFMAAWRDPSSAVTVARRVAAHSRDRLAGWPRGTRVANGGAIVACLVAALHGRGVPLRPSAAVARLVRDGERVAGVELSTGETIFARAGVILAAGGFGPASARRFPALAGRSEHVSAPPKVASPDAIALAEAAGAAVTSASHPALWAPVSVVPLPGGRTAPWPHFGDRAKPGVIAVDRTGARFVNEGVTYHDFVPSMVKAAGNGPVQAFLLCDHRAIRRYGLGAVGPRPVPLAPFISRGYLKHGRTVRDLAAAIGVPADRLEETVARFNRAAERGEDPAFGRGADAYSRSNGDPDHRPNPSLAPLTRPPFYAIRMVSGDIGALAGLATGVHGEVLDGAGRPIAGLYAAGNAAFAMTGGAYPAAGITLGPALTFGMLAARHAASALGGRAAA